MSRITRMYYCSCCDTKIEILQDRSEGAPECKNCGIDMAKLPSVARFSSDKFGKVK